MTQKTASNPQGLPWKNLTEFRASTTFSEKVGRVVNNLIFIAASISLGAIVTRQLRLAAPFLSYAAYASLALAIRKIVHTVIGYPVYQATSYDRDVLARQEETAIQGLNSRGYITQKIALHKSGVSYAAILIGHEDTIANGKWSLHALGNGMAMEDVMDSIPFQNKLYGANTLLINGAGVGRSQGYPTRYQLGAGFEAGLQLLEKDVKATHIAFRGLSLGGGMISEAVQAHSFDTAKIHYLGTSDRSFSYLSSTAATFVGWIATIAFFLTGQELDGVAGAKKLTKLNIKHIIIQHSSPGNQGSDGVIDDSVSLAPALKEAPNRDFLLSEDILHNGDLPPAIESELTQHMKEFFEQPKK